MLSLIRRLIHSRLGLIITFAVLVLIALLFAAGDITGLSQGGGGVTGGTVATVAGEKVTAAELRSRAQTDMESFRQEQPTLDLAQYVAGGGLDGTLTRLTDGLVFERFGRNLGMVISKRAIDGQIASIPSFKGLDGKFSQQAYERLLADRRMTDAQVRTIFARDMVAQQLLFPTLGASQVPALLAQPYAALLLEKRDGQAGFISTRAIGAGALPTDAEVTQYYQRNVARYTIPERRAIRYAVVTADQVRDKVTPSDAEIAQAYQSQRARFAATQKRSVSQVVLADRATADSVVAKVKSGSSVQDAARAIGLEALVLTGLEKPAYAAQTSAAIADAVFAAASNAVVGPVRSPLGYTVASVTAIDQVPGKSLEQARAELVTTLTRDKTVTTLGTMRDAIEDSVSGRATFDEVIADQKLTPRATPALLADGRNPDDATLKAAPDFLPVVTAAFQAEQGDSPQLVPIGTDGGFAVVALQRIVPAAAPPLAKVRAVVARDFAIDRARRAARVLAAKVTADVGKGISLAQALAATGIKTPPVQPLNASRAQLAANPRNVPPPLALMFSMTEKTAKLLEAPNNEGWFIIYLDKIERGNAAGRKSVIDAARADLGKVIGREYVEQFTAAVRAAIGVKKNDKVIAEVRTALASGAN